MPDGDWEYSNDADSVGVVNTNNDTGEVEVVVGTNAEQEPAGNDNTEGGSEPPDNVSSI